MDVIRQRGPALHEYMVLTSVGAMSGAESYPRASARTQRFTLGEPRLFTVSTDGERVAFVRSRGGEDTMNCLWLHDVRSGTETLVADPMALTSTDGPGDDLERARRERAREGAGGIVSYATDPQVRVAAFALGGELFVAGMLSASARPLAVDGPVFDPRPDPLATRVAYVAGNALCVAELDGSVTVLASDDDPLVTWGAAEFVAGEEMGRSRGYWWSPDGRSVAATRVCTTNVAVWWITDPASPADTPAKHRYPAAGTSNATVTLHVLGLDGTRCDVAWDSERYEYLVDVLWRADGVLSLIVQSRNQRDVAWLTADPTTGVTTTVALDTDSQWVDIVPGGWGWLEDQRLVRCVDSGGVRRLTVDGAPVTGDSLNIQRAHVSTDHVVFVANDLTTPESHCVMQWSDDGHVVALSAPTGMHSAAAGGATAVIRSQSLDSARATFGVLTDGGDGAAHVAPGITSNAAPTPLDLNIVLMRLGPRELPAALLLPRDGGTGMLPVLLDPYGGPHAQRVLHSRAAHQSSQWFADQGFAVLVIDGRGTPGLGSTWERAIHLDMAGPILEDQIDGLIAAALIEPRLDLSRVAIRGWSFGGYLAALAVLRQPDVFHAAVAGAPVTDWRLYDTHYTERYLGHPDDQPDVYERSSLLGDAPNLERPLLLIHGLADDNVVAAHTLRLSGELMAAGRAHQVLPLSGVSHMTPQEVVAENLLLLQVQFLKTSLGML
jgi:dipeptidyl-peptidase 4